MQFADEEILAFLRNLAVVDVDARAAPPHELAPRIAERLGADAWGSDYCHFLVNGSSAGNVAFFLAHLSPGDRVIIARDIHKSLMTALIHTGVQPIYVAPQLHAELDFGIGIEPELLQSVSKPVWADGRG